MGQSTSQMVVEAASGVHADIDEQLFLQHRSPMGPDDPEALYWQHDPQFPDDAGEKATQSRSQTICPDDTATTKEPVAADQDHTKDLDNDSATQSTLEATAPDDDATIEECAAIDPDLTKDLGSLLVKKEGQDGDAQPTQENVINCGQNDFLSTSTPKDMDKQDKDDILKAIHRIQKSIDTLRQEGKSLHKTQLETRKEVSRISARLAARYRSPRSYPIPLCQ